MWEILHFTRVFQQSLIVAPLIFASDDFFIGAKWRPFIYKMGCLCSSQRRDEDQSKEQAQVYPLPVIDPSESHNSAIFDPEFTAGNKKHKAKQESEPLLETQEAVSAVPAKKDDESSDTSSSIDQNMISKLLAEVDTSDLSD